MTQVLPQPLTMRFHQGVRAGALALVAAASFFASSASSFAGASDIKAINTALGGGKTIQTATTAELIAAYDAAIAANSKLKPGVVVGEILKLAGSNAPDVGVQFGLKFAANSAKETIAADAARTAGGAKGNVSKVPDFAANLNIDDAAAIRIAILAKGSKPGSGAILGGRASQIPDTGAGSATALALTALSDKNLTGNAQDIARYISATVADGAAFTTAVAGAAANVKLADKIVFGTVAGLPTSAGAIVNAALNIPGASGKPNLLVPKIVGMLKTIGAAADIEQIQKVAVAVAARIGTTGINSLKLAQATSAATTLAKALVAKPVGTSPTANSPIPFQNRVDELGELAASMLAGIATNPDFTKLDSKGLASTASKTVVALLKGIAGAAKTKTPGVTGPNYTNVLSYITGSLALTVANLPGTITNFTQVKTALTSILQDAKTIDGILKSYKIVGTDATNIKADIAAVLAGTANPARFENGFDNGTLGIPGITDPETNSRSL